MAMHGRLEQKVLITIAVKWKKKLWADMRDMQKQAWCCEDGKAMI